MQRSMTLMLLARHELNALSASAQSVARMARETKDDQLLAKATELEADVQNELTCRAREADDVPF